MSQLEKNTANQPDFPVTERVREALAVTQRGVDELLPEAEWVRKLARSEAIKQNQTIRLCKANAELDDCSAASGAWDAWVLIDTASPATVIRAGRFDGRLIISAAFTELRFSGQGLIRSQNNQPLNSAFELCADDAEFADNGRTLTFLSGGRSSIQLSQCGS